MTYVQQSTVIQAALIQASMPPLLHLLHCVSCNCRQAMRQQKLHSTQLACDGTCGARASEKRFCQPSPPMHRQKARHRQGPKAFQGMMPQMSGLTYE